MDLLSLIFPILNNVIDAETLLANKFLLGQVKFISFIALQLELIFFSCNVKNGNFDYQTFKVDSFKNERVHEYWFFFANSYFTPTFLDPYRLLC
jgi:hypothetical protein